MRPHMIYISLLLALLGAAQPVWATGATDALKGPVQNVLELLNDVQYRSQKNSAEQRAQIDGIIRPVFDFNEIARRSLAANWKRLSENQSREFVQLFADLLVTTYIKRLQSDYTGQTVLFVKETKRAEGKVSVNTKIVRDKISTPVDYNMKLTNNTWLVYDVLVEGTSLTQNYRTQFRNILMKESPEALLQRLRDKTLPAK